MGYFIVWMGRYDIDGRPSTFVGTLLLKSEKKARTLARNIVGPTGWVEPASTQEIAIGVTCGALPLGFSSKKFLFIMASSKIKTVAIPGFSRYSMALDGRVVNISTGTVMPPINGILKLINDDGRPQSFSVTQKYREIFPLKITGNLKHLTGDLLLKRSGYQRFKLTDEQVIEIRALYAAGQLTKRQGEERYGVAQQTIGKIVNEKIYRHLLPVKSEFSKALDHLLNS